MQCTLPNVWTSQPKLRFNVQFKIEFHLLTFASYHLKQKSKLKPFAILIISIVIMTKERQKCKLKPDTKWHMTYDLWEHSTWHRMTELLNVLLFTSVQSCDQKHLHLFINFDDSQNFISIISILMFSIPKRPFESWSNWEFISFQYLYLWQWNTIISVVHLFVSSIRLLIVWIRNYNRLEIINEWNIVLYFCPFKLIELINYNWWITWTLQAVLLGKENLMKVEVEVMRLLSVRRTKVASIIATKSLISQAPDLSQFIIILITNVDLIPRVNLPLNRAAHWVCTKLTLTSHRHHVLLLNCINFY